MRTGKVKRLLIAPLDWGLGHATRCIPLINYIQKLGHEAVIAGNESQQAFFRKIFPGINVWHLDGYNVRYSRHKATFLPVLLRQLPRLTHTIKQEKEWLHRQMQQNPVDGIISDNRYGLYHDHIPSVIMTHQLQIMTGMGSYTDHFIRSLHYRYLNRFDAVWVPDVPEYPNLSGKLGHPDKIPGHTIYIGLLSQYTNDNTSGIMPKHLLILLSGPEPQRSLLSDLLWEQVQSHKGKVVFVEGSNRAVSREQIPPHITWHNLLTTYDLQPLIRDASCIVCRSGYSSLMDLVALGKTAILIPTPGQTEQEYLGNHLQQQGIFYTAQQHRFSLKTALHNINSFPFTKPLATEHFLLHQPTLADWINRL